MTAILRSPVNDKSITSLSGSSQTLLAANNTRNFLFVQNTGNANIGVNIAAGTAAIAGTGTITLTPNGSLLFDAFVPTGQINVIGTAAQSVTCFEA